MPHEGRAITYNSSTTTVPRHSLRILQATPRHWRHRLATALSLLCLFSAPVEVALPDAHDGIGVASAAAVHHGEEQAPEPDTAPDSHAVHVDHCGHSHLAGPVASTQGQALDAYEQTLSAREPRGLHESVTLALPQRPPIR